MREQRVHFGGGGSGNAIVLDSITGYGILRAAGTTVPSGAKGYAPGCIFHDMDAAAGAQLFVNEGTVASCSFVAIPTGGSTGAADIGIADAGNFTAQTTVEGALQEIYQDSLSLLTHIPIPLVTWRLAESNDVPVIAVAGGNGGNMGRDTAPKLIRINAGTDKGLRIQYAANGVIEIMADFVYPPDLDDTAILTFNMLANMGGASDTPTVAVGYFEGLGDTNAGGNTAAVTGVTITQYTRAIAAADVGAYPNKASLQLTPAAHGTDTLNIYATWITYKRKLRTS